MNADKVKAKAELPNSEVEALAVSVQEAETKAQTAKSKARRAKQELKRVKRLSPNMEA